MCDYCSWIDQILTRIRNEIKPEKKKRRVYVDPVIIVHGGAGKIPRNKRKRILCEVWKTLHLNPYFNCLIRKIKIFNSNRLKMQQLKHIAILSTVDQQWMR